MTLRRIPGRRIAGWLALAGAAGAALSWGPQTDTVDAPAARPTATAPAAKSGGERFTGLPAREAIAAARADLFAARSWGPPRAAAATDPTDPAAAPPPAAAAPQPPPVPYRFAGQVVHDGAARIVLAKGDLVFTVREGEVLDDDYRVESIRPDEVTLLYLPLGTQDHLPVTSALGLQAPPVVAAVRSAQLR